MAWKCKKCGGKIYAIVTSEQSKTFTLGKEGTPKYKKKNSQEWKHKNYASTTNRAKMEKDILKISGSGKFKIVGMWEE